MRRQKASVERLAQHLGCTRTTLGRAVKPVRAAADHEASFAGVTSLGVVVITPCSHSHVPVTLTNLIEQDS